MNSAIENEPRFRAYGEDEGDVLAVAVAILGGQHNGLDVERARYSHLRKGRKWNGSRRRGR
jgi:hypothetical protein